MLRLPIRLIPVKTSIDFLRYKMVAFVLSVFLSVAAVVVLATMGLNFGIDFSGGVVLEVRPTADGGIEDIRTALGTRGYGNAIIQPFGKDNDVMIRLQPKVDVNQADEVKAVQEILTTALDGRIEFRRVDYVGPKVGRELVSSGMQAVLIAILGMLLYIWFRFDWQFGIGAVVSLVHDAIITIGFFVVSGYDFDLTSVAAILTIIGYSINDTVVIYDRVRENISKYRDLALKEIVNRSINETLSRTIMTVATTLLVCLALVLVGGEVLRGFSMALLFGIAFGTYSSIYIAAPTLLYTGLKTRKQA